MHAALLTELMWLHNPAENESLCVALRWIENLKSGLKNSLVYRNVIWLQCGVATHSFQRIYEGCKVSEEGRCLECLLAVDTGEGHTAHIMKHFLLLLTVKRTGWCIEMLPAPYQGFLCGVFSAVNNR